jgi:hypothetical protein
MKKSKVNKYVVRMALRVVIGVLASLTARPAAADLTAVATKENDFTIADQPLGKTVPVPATVAQKIDNLVNAAYAQWKCEPGEECYYNRDYFYGPVFRIAAPKGLELYVFRRKAPFDADLFFFILFNPLTKKATQHPPYIFAKWIGCCGLELHTPLLSFEDVDRDGQGEIVIQEQVHNGTMYNAVVYHYYHVSADLVLTPILAVETQLLDLFTEDQGGIIIRTLQKVSKNQLRMDVFLDLPGSASKRHKLGEVVLRNAGSGTPFVILQRRVFDSKYAAVLITASGESESTFLRYGYRFYY